jgi:hypothetical protein
VVLILHLLYGQEWWAFFMCFQAIWTSSFEKVLFSSLAYFFIGSQVLGEFSLLCSLYILVIGHLSYV